MHVASHRMGWDGTEGSDQVSYDTAERLIAAGWRERLDSFVTLHYITGRWGLGRETAQGA